MTHRFHMYGVSQAIRLSSRLVTLCLVLTSLGCDQITQIVTPDTSGTVRIGLILPTDRLVEAQNGVQLALAEINKQSDIPGVTIELIVKDNQADPVRSGELTEELITQDGVSAIVGGLFSTNAVQMAPIAQRHGIPMMAIGATNPAVTQESGDFVFLAAFADTFQGQVMAQFAAEELGAETAAVLTQVGDVYSEGLSQFFEDSFASLGGQLVGREVYAAGDVDFTEQLTRIGAETPGVVFMPGFPPEVPLAVAQGRTTPENGGPGITATFLGGDGWAFGELSTQDKVTLEGSYFSDHFSPETQDAVSREFVSDYEAMFGIPPNGLAALGYDSLRLVVTAMHRAGTIVPEAVRDEIAATRDYHGATSLSHYDENRHPQKSTAIMKMENGTIGLHQQVEP